MLRYLHSYISLSSLFEVQQNQKSIFSKEEDFILSNDGWILLVIAKKKDFSPNQYIIIEMLSTHF